MKKKKKKSGKILPKNGKVHTYKKGVCIVCSHREEDDDMVPESICKFVERMKNHG